MTLAISSTENTLATTAATEIGEIMTSGATVAGNPAIAATPNYSSNADVVGSFKAMAAGIIRQVTGGSLGVATVIEIIKGSGQNHVVSGAFGTTLQVVVRDSANKPVPGVVVVFTPPVSGASCSLTSPAVTDVNGVTEVTATANSVSGTYGVKAEAFGSPLISVEFVLTNNPKIAYANASTTSGQPVLQGVNNTINFDSVTKDTVAGITTGSNWVYRATANNAGLYHISTLVSLTDSTTIDYAELSIWRVQPSSNTDSLEVVLNAAGPTYDVLNQGNVLNGDTYIELAEGEGLRIKARITDTSDIYNSTLNTAAGTNWIRIHRVSDIPT